MFSNHHRPLLAVVLGAVLLLVLPAAGAPSRDWRDTPLDELRAIPGIDVVEVTFDGREPQEHGLAVHGSLPKPLKVSFPKSGTEIAWGTQASADDRPWMRHFPLDITDEAFRDADHAAVDIYVTYHLAAWSGLQVEASTSEGLKVVDNGWGNTSNWRTEFTAADDVDFTADGPHLRVAGANGTLYIKRVRLIGYKRSGPDVRWDRLLRPRSLEAGTSDGIFAFAPGEGQARLAVENLATQDKDLDYTFSISTLGDESVVHQSSGKVTIGGASTESIDMSFDASDWKLGPYVGSIVVNDSDASEPMLSLPLTLGVIDGETRRLERARGNASYWFGLDAANNEIFKTGTDQSFAYYDLLGVDILRGVPHASKGKVSSVSHISDMMGKLADHDMRSAYIAWPDAWQKNGSEYEKDREKRVGALAALAAAYGGREPGKIPYFEIGNEPDLTFFYGRPAKDYVESYHMAYDAIRDADPEHKAMVMHGGLCFHGSDGDRRAPRLSA